MPRLVGWWNRLGSVASGLKILRTPHLRLRCFPLFIVSSRGYWSGAFIPSLEALLLPTVIGLAHIPGLFVSLLFAFFTKAASASQPHACRFPSGKPLENRSRPVHLVQLKESKSYIQYMEYRRLRGYRLEPN
jgi:hypothetical protein